MRITERATELLVALAWVLALLGAMLVITASVRHHRSHPHPTSGGIYGGDPPDRSLEMLSRAYGCSYGGAR